MKIRGSIGLSPWPEISDRAREHYRALFDMTGTTAFLEGFGEGEEKPLPLNYLEGRITRAGKKGRPSGK
jgi:hypothetical protein